MTSGTTTTITVRYFAAARAAAGVEVEKIQVASAATIADLLDEVAVRDHGAPVAGATSLDVLPPFAGG